MNHTFRNVAIIYDYNIRKVCKYYHDVSFWDYNVCNFNDSKYAYICNLKYKARCIDWPIRSVCDIYRAPALGSMHYPKDDSLRNIAKGDSYA